MTWSINSVCHGSTRGVWHHPCPYLLSQDCCCLVAKSCTTLWAPMDCNRPGSSVHGISQARIMEYIAISFSRESSQPRDGTCVSCICRWILYHWATWESQDSKTKWKPLEDREHSLYSQSHIIKVQSPIFPMPTGPSTSLWPWVNPREFIRLSFPIFIFFLIFFLCGPFFKSLLNLLQCRFCLTLWCFGQKTCGILTPRAEIKLTPLHWRPKFLFCFVFIYFLIEG